MGKNKSKIIIASDHGGFELKEQLKSYFSSQKIEFIDMGADSMKDIDYPIIVKSAIAKLKQEPNSFAILICGAGVGVSIAANRFKGVRAALCYSTEIAKLAREHNDANVLCLGGRFIDINTAIAITQTFIETKPLNLVRHVRRRAELDNLDSAT